MSSHAVCGVDDGDDDRPALGGDDANDQLGKSRGHYVIMLLIVCQHLTLLLF